MATRGSPVVAMLGGTVVGIGLDTNRPGSGGLDGYGNCVVVQTSGNIPGMPGTFWVLYAHLRDAPLVTVGQRVQAGTPIGFVGNTTNGRFSGPNCRGPVGTCSMGPHTHVEVRRRPFPSSYDHDTIDPEILFNGLGIDWTGWHREAERKVGGTLQVRVGGPSDCRAGGASSLSGLLIPGPDPFGIVGLRGDFGIVYGSSAGGQAGAGEQYIPASVLSPNYPGVTVASPDVDPPDYDDTAPAASSGSSGGATLALGAAAVIGLFAWMKR